jgi:hypothetical protein
MTTLQTFKAIINGTLFSVDQLRGNKGRQDIQYRIKSTIVTSEKWVIIFPETLLTADDFWKLNPIKHERI